MKTELTQQEALKEWANIFEALLRYVETVENLKDEETLPYDFTKTYASYMWNSSHENIVRSFIPKCLTQEERNKFELKVKRDYIRVANRVIDRVAKANGFFKLGKVDSLHYHSDFLTFLKAFVLSD